MSDARSDRDRALTRKAAVQGGFVTRAQLLELGYLPGWIKHQARDGRLIRAYRGVYAVGHMPRHPEARAFGAQLALGSRSAVSGRSACSFYGVFRRWQEPFELVTPENRRPSGLIVHHSTTLIHRDIWPFDGLRVTSPARTALDIAPRLDEDGQKRAVDHLRLRHHLRLDQLADVVARNPRHPGARELRRLLHSAGPRPSRSDLERAWPLFAQTYHLPAYLQNQLVGAFEVDVLFLPARLIVELDTIETHLLNFASDRERDAEILARYGIPTIRITWEMLQQEPGRQAERILAVLATR